MDGIIIYFSDKDIFRWAVMKEENRKVKSEKNETISGIILKTMTSQWDALI